MQTARPHNYRPACSRQDLINYHRTRTQVPHTLSYVEYSDKAYLQFYCCHCASDSYRNFDFLASLTCIASQANEVSAMRRQAESESKLLTFYHVCLSTLNMPCSSDVVHFLVLLFLNLKFHLTLNLSCGNAYTDSVRS